MSLFIFFQNSRRAQRQIAITDVVEVTDRFFTISTGSPTQLFLYLTELVQAADFIPNLRSLFTGSGAVDSRIQWLVVIRGPNGTERYTDGDSVVVTVDPDNPGSSDNGLFSSRITTEFEITRSLSDPLFGHDEIDNVTFGLQNMDQALNNWRTTNYKGSDVYIYKYFHTFEVATPEMVAVLDNRVFGDVITVTALSKDADILVTPLPAVGKLNDVNTIIFPRAYIDDLGAIIGVILGYATLIPGRYVGFFEDEDIPPASMLAEISDEIDPIHDYTFAIGNVGLPQIYRAGFPVDPTEYKISTSLYPGFTTIRFYVAQTAVDGGLYQITADVHGFYSSITSRGFYREAWLENDVLEQADKHLIACWRFSEAEGDAVDEINGFAGTVNGTVTRGVPGGVPEDNNKAYRFDATGYVDFGDTADQFDFSGSFTVEFLFRRVPTSIVAAGGTYEPLISKWDGTNGFYIDLKPGSGQIRVVAKTADTSDIGSTLADGFWHHIIVVFTASTSLKVYIDGVLVNTTAHALASVGASSASLLANKRQSTAGMASGDIDELYLRDTALDATQAATRYSYLRGMLCEFKFDRNIRDNAGYQSPNTSAANSTITLDGAVDPETLEDYFIEGHCPYGKSALIVQPEPIASGSSVLVSKGFYAQSTYNYLLGSQKIVIRIIFKLYSEGVNPSLGPCAIKGGLTSALSGSSLVDGWGLFRTGPYTYAFKVVTTGSGELTLSLGSLAANVYYDVCLMCNEGVFALYVNGILVDEQTTASSNKISYAYSGAPLFIPYQTWNAALDYFSIQQVTGTAAEEKVNIVNDHYLLKRNGVEHIRRIITDTRWGLGQELDSVSSDFIVARKAWANTLVNADIGLPELVQAKDLLDQILMLRGGRLYKEVNNKWAVELLTAADEADVTPIGHGGGNHDNMVGEPPSFPDTSLVDTVKTLQVNYRPARDPNSGAFSQLSQHGQYPGDLSDRGKLEERNAAAVYDHESAYYVLYFIGKQLTAYQAEDGQLTCTVKEPTGRLLRPGSLTAVYIERWGLSGTLYRVKKIVSRLASHTLELVKYDSTAHDIPALGTLPVDDEGSDRFTIPSAVDWYLLVSPILDFENNAMGIHGSIAKKRLIPMESIESTVGSVSAVGATDSVEALEENDGDISYVLFDGTGGTQTFNFDELRAGLRSGRIARVAIRVAWRRISTSGSSSATISFPGLHPGTTLTVPVNGGNYAINIGLAYNQAHPTGEDPRDWTLSDIDDITMQITVANTGDSVVRISWIELSVYFEDHLALARDLDSVLIFRRKRNTTEPFSEYNPDPEIEVPYKIIYSLSFDDFDVEVASTGVNIYTYQAAFKDKSTLISALITGSSLAIQ